MKIQRTFVKAVSVLTATLGLAVSASPVFAAEYSNRPVRFIVPAAPGGTTDGLARIFSARLSDVFSQQVVVDNRASSSGVVAGEITKAAAPDGHTLFLPYHQHTVNAALLKKLPYHPVNDFTPITQFDIPTVSESDLPGFEAVGWYGAKMY